MSGNQYNFTSIELEMKISGEENNITRKSVI